MISSLGIIALLLFVSFVSGNTLLPKNCKEHLKRGSKKSGRYGIWTESGIHNVLCDQDTAEGGWTVIQQRVNGDVPFWNANWTQYRNGFGEIGNNDDFWLGNELIHELTNQYSGEVTLRIELKGDRQPGSRHSDDFYIGEYFFKLANETTDYTITIKTDPNGHGNATTGWYDWTASNGKKFSTIDRLNDPEPNCQTKYRIGGWWSNHCGLAALNGAYVPERWGDGYGMFFVIKGLYIINPRTSRMMIRDREGKPFSS